MVVNSSIFNSKMIVRFLGKLCFFFVILFVVDLVGGSVLGYFFQKTKFGDNWPKTNWAISESFDVVILGSSRCFRHYVPSIISEQTGLSVFNAGENGQYLLYAYAVEQLIFEKYNPEIIVLDLLPSYIVQLDDSQSEFDRLEILAPYMSNKAIRELLIQDNFYNRIKQLSKLYRYNSRVLNIADNIRNGPGNSDNGYVSVGIPKLRETNKFLVDMMQEPRIDKYKLEILTNFINAAQERQVQVVFSFSPTLEPLSENVNTLICEFRKIADSNGIPFLAYTPESHPEYMNRGFFMDYIHMNALGAEKFSKEFGYKLSSLLRPAVAEIED